MNDEQTQTQLQTQQHKNDWLTPIVSVVSLLVIAGQFLMFFSSGGYTIGAKVEEVNKKLELLQQEIKYTNQLQDARIDSLDSRVNATAQNLEKR